MSERRSRPRYDSHNYAMTPDESLCLGCAYIYPTSIAGFDAEVYGWVRASHAAVLDEPLMAALRAWLQDAWPFRRVAFPGRDQPWPL